MKIQKRWGGFKQYFPLFPWLWHCVKRADEVRYLDQLCWPGMATLKGGTLTPETSILDTYNNWRSKMFCIKLIFSHKIKATLLFLSQSVDIFWSFGYHLNLSLLFCSYSSDDHSQILNDSLRDLMTFQFFGLIGSLIDIWFPDLLIYSFSFFFGKITSYDCWQYVVDDWIIGWQGSD